MAITRENLQALMAEYHKEAQAEQAHYADVRDLASQETPERFLTPSKLGGKKKIALKYGRLGMKVQDLVAAYARMGIDVEIGDGVMKFSPDDLRKLIVHDKKRRKRFDDSTRGIPYAKLLRSSAAKDKERVGTVKTATYYGRKGDILLFQVSGNSKPHYQVRIRLEGWKDAVTNPQTITVPALTVAQKLLAGNLSFDCQCGRHQFWYRYLACIGNYAIEPPSERDYPKIRNPTLTGCCCKHVLKVLGDFKSKRIQFLLAKAIEQARKHPDTVGTPPTRIMGLKDLSLARAKRMSRDAMNAFAQYKQEADKIKKRMKPRAGTQKKKRLSEKVWQAIEDLFKMSRASGIRPDAMLNQIAKANGIKRADLDKLIRERGL